MAKYGTFCYSQAPYGIRTRVYSEITAKFNLLGRISRTFIIQYQVFFRIQKQIVVNYHIFNRIYQIATLPYNIYISAKETITAKFNLYIRATKEFTLKYSLVVRVCNTLTAKYNLYSLTGLWATPTKKPVTEYSCVIGITTPAYAEQARPGQRYGTFKYGTRKYGRIGISVTTKPSTNFINIEKPATADYAEVATAER